MIDVNLEIGIVWIWFKIGSLSNVFYNGFIFNIVNIKRNMLGFYSCIVGNFIGILVVVMIYVDVLCE